jgi:malonate-semialdehyde dehydrogenase (acetylating)/methylmalonate-semialdehyde dehydrogenase
MQKPAMPPSFGAKSYAFTPYVDIKNWIGGQWREGSSGAWLDVENPRHGKAMGRVTLSTAKDVAAAVEAGKRAFPAWRATPMRERAQVLYRLKQLMERDLDELCWLVSHENGKTYAEGKGDVEKGIECVEFAASLHMMADGGQLDVSRGVNCRVTHEPLGVVAGIVPFNFPVMVPLWMLATSIACGNAFVLKPSEKDPSASLLLAELLAEAGLPDGVFGVVQGDRTAVDRLIEHPDVAALSFVGSTPVARSIYERGTAAGKRVQALGGAKNHMVVLPDADLDAAADAAVSAAYGSAGERCMAISVTVAVGDVAEPLVEAIRARIGDIVVAPGDHPDAEMGPLITAEHRANVAGHIARAGDEGASVVVDGRQLEVEGGGFFLGPTLVDHVAPRMEIYQHEVFGPVLSIVRVDTYDEAIRLVNEHPFGNGTAIFTRDGGAARRFQFDVEAGMVGINVPIPVPVAYYSFGGWKASLFGDTHIYGPDGVRFCTRTKVVTSRWPDPSTSSVDLGFPQNR